MSTDTLPSTTEESKAQEAKAQADAEKNTEEPKQLDDLHTEHGDTTIADTVVEKIAGIAVREISGVYAMGSAAGRAISGLTSRVSGKSNVSSGVKIEKGEYQTAVDVAVVVEYGVSIAEVSENIRQNVIDKVEYATGLEVVSVDVEISDVHLPEDDSDDDQSSSSSSSSDLK